MNVHPLRQDSRRRGFLPVSTPGVWRFVVVTGGGGGREDVWLMDMMRRWESLAIL